jgi:NADP-dependent 3-hydroxy acid dehydrogenase YdfG
VDGIEQWQGKVALVTGASSGMGEAVARALAAHGMRVALAARRLERLEVLQRDIAAAGGQALPVAVDLRDEAAILAMFNAVRKAWGDPDVLINNAGLGWENTLPDGKTAEWREMLDVNVLAASVCMREAVRGMRAKKDVGVVINVASSLSRRVPAGKKLAFYAATKFALRALSDGMREELMAEGAPIRVHLLSPGLTVTGFHEKFYRDASKAKENYDKLNPLSTAEVAKAVCFMLSMPKNVVFDEILFRSVGQVY